MQAPFFSNIRLWLLSVAQSGPELLNFLIYSLHTGITGVYHHAKSRHKHLKEKSQVQCDAGL